MTHWIFLISTLAVVYCRPQESPAVDFIDDVQSKVTIIPFYGGGKGQSLQIIERPDGTVITHIIQTPVNTPTPTEEVINTAELENPPLPSKQDLDFGSNIRKIHRTAINIIKLQEIAKKNGKLNTDEESLYQQNMDELNSSAKNLAQLQEQEDKFSFENREGVNEWFERKKSNKKDKDKKKKEEEEKKKEEERKKEEEEERRKEEEKKKEEQNKAEEEERRKKEEEKNKNEKPKEEEEEEEGEDEDNDNDGIAIGLPPDDASVAEAKPVGLAVAGEGGVAASKPIATAVVGPGGLAIARPVGTAIAGVAPDQALVPIYAEGYVGGNKPKRYGSTNKSDAASELLNKIISKYHQV
ncbi:golgin subfamily A member 6-like protein 7 isoform X2 [Zophobas morio]|uniref:golgin subfamily A member 6-like protein 7 isoform X2 n=1 Tax=Zophobas morio TaxID=2755281 RepID=UPI0030830B4C